MPTVSEMREQSRICMQAAEDAADAHSRARLGTRGLVLAMLARIESEKGEAKDRKAVYLGGKRVGLAKTWQEVGDLVGEALARRVTMPELFRNSSEGPDGFYIRTQG
jgi:hypothetical protein